MSYLISYSRQICTKLVHFLSLKHATIFPEDIRRMIPSLKENLQSDTKHIARRLTVARHKNSFVLHSTIHIQLYKRKNAAHVCDNYVSRVLRAVQLNIQNELQSRYVTGH